MRTEDRGLGGGGCEDSRQVVENVSVYSTSNRDVHHILGGVCVFCLPCLFGECV